MGKFHDEAHDLQRLCWMQGVREQMAVCSRIARPPGARSLPLNLRNVGMAPLVAQRQSYSNSMATCRGNIAGIRKHSLDLRISAVWAAFRA